ncbi:hypothetical protein MTR67_034452, partial [Solanum verrucosum]
NITTSPVAPLFLEIGSPVTSTKARARAVTIDRFSFNTLRLCSLHICLAVVLATAMDKLLDRSFLILDNLESRKPYGPTLLKNIVKKCVAKVHSVQLVGIANPLGDPSFGQVHRLSALAFSKFKFCNFGRYRTASRNCLATRRLLISIADLIFSFRAWHIGTLGKTKAI